MSAMRLVQAIGVTLALAAPAAAHNIPFPVLLDPNVACQRFPAGEPRNDCLRKNQFGYDQARALWDRMSEGSIRVCLDTEKRRSPADPWAYAAFGACLSEVYWTVDYPRETAPPFQRR